MPEWYEGRGGGMLQDSKEVCKLLEEFKEFGGEEPEPVDIVPAAEGVISVEVAWNGYSGGTSVNRLDAHLEKLAPFIVGEEALCFYYSHENTRDVMYIGSEAQKAKSISDNALLEVDKLKNLLSAADKLKAIEILTEM